MLPEKNKNKGQLFFHKQLKYIISKPYHTRFKNNETCVKRDERMIFGWLVLDLTAL